VGELSDEAYTLQDIVQTQAIEIKVASQYTSHFCIINAQPQSLRSSSESLREALDKAKTQAAHSSAALAQSQARETILTADLECKVKYSRTLQFIAHPAFPPPPAPSFSLHS
jgi:hypothetical protein